MPVIDGLIFAFILAPLVNTFDFLFLKHHYNKNHIVSDVPKKLRNKLPRLQTEGKNANDVYEDFASIDSAYSSAENMFDKDAEEQESNLRHKKHFSAFSDMSLSLEKVFTGEKDKNQKKIIPFKKIRGLSVFCTLILLIICIVLIFRQLIPQLINSIQNIIIQFPNYQRNFNEWIDEILVKHPFLEELYNMVSGDYYTQIMTFVNNNILSRAEDLLANVTTGAVSMIRSIMNILVGLIISIYLLYSKEHMLGQGRKVIYALLNREDAKLCFEQLGFINNTFSGFFVGKVLDSLIIGLLCFILCSILGMPYSILISVIVGVTNIIPYFGPFIGAIPSAILVLMVDPQKALYFIIMILLLQQFDGNVLGPKILGSSTGLSSFWVIFAIIIFGGFFGFVGMLVGIPVFAVIYTLFSEYITHRLRKKGINAKADDFAETDPADPHWDIMDAETHIPSSGDVMIRDSQIYDPMMDDADIADVSKGHEEDED